MLGKVQVDREARQVIAPCLGYTVQGSGFRVQGSGFGVQGPGFRVQGETRSADAVEAEEVGEESDPLVSTPAPAQRFHQNLTKVTCSSSKILSKVN